MPDLFNVTTKLKEDIQDPEALNQALATGTHSFANGEEIPAVNPYGEKVWIKSDEVHQKVAAGYKLPTNNELEIEKFVDDNSGVMGSIGVGAKSFANQLALGVPELIQEKTGNPLDVAKNRALKKEHGYSNFIGGAGGFIGSMFAPGPAHLFRGAAAARKAVTAQIAERLGVEAAEGASQRAINQTAKDIASRLSGFGAEGAAIAAPHAITEAMLGDPEAAGEHLLAGAGIGVMFGTGHELFKLGGKVKKEIADSEIMQNTNIKKFSRQLAQVWTGVPEERFETYLNNRERINNAKPYEQLFDEVDAVTSSVRNEVDNLKSAVSEKEKELNQAYSNARKDLAEAKVPQVVGEEIDLSLRNLKSTIGELSSKADEVLGEIPGGQSLDFMIDLVKDAKKKFVPVYIGAKAKSVFAKLDEIEKDLNVFRRESSPEWNSAIYGKMPDRYQKVPYPAVRDVIQQVREGIDWNPTSSEFNTRLNKAYQAFTEKLSDKIKLDSPEYAVYMTELSNLSSLHSKMHEYGFTDKTIGSSRIDKIVKSGDEHGEKLIRDYDQAAGTNFSKELRKHNLNKFILKKSGTGDLRRVLNPELYQEMNSLKEKLSHAEKFYEPMSSLTRERIQAAMANLDRKKPNINTRRAFEYLDTLYKPGSKDKYNFVQEIDDRNILDMFMKQDKAGSRKTNLSTVVSGGLASLLGFGAAGPVGAIAGAMGGATLDIYGGQLLKYGIDKFPAASGLLFVEKKMGENAAKIEKLPGILERMSNRTPAPFKTSTAPISALWRILEATKSKDEHQHSDKKLSESTKKISEISERVSQLLNDPHLLHAHMEEMTQGLMQGGAPQIAEALTTSVTNVLKYIDLIIPKPPKPSSPFERRTAWIPPDYQVTAFAQKLQVLENPFMVLDALENGTLTKNHIQSLKSVFPSIFSEIQSRIMQIATSGVELSMDYDKRLKLSLLLEVPLDDSVTKRNINYFQSSFTQQAQENAHGSSSGSSVSAVDYGREQQTQAQRMLAPRG